MLRIYRIIPLFLLYLLFQVWPNTLKAQTNLSTGDIAFTSFSSESSASDTFAIMFLADITTGTQLVFTDGQYTDATGYFVFPAASFTDWVLVWQSTSNITSGTQIKFWTGSNSCSVNCSAGCSSGNILTGRGLSLPTSGDQLFVCQGGTIDTTSATKKYTPGTVIAGIHNNNIAGTTTDANWDNGAGASTSNSELPNALTTGVNCIRLVYASGLDGEADNGRYNCSVLTGSAATLRTAINNINNWDLDDNNPFSPAICMPAGISVSSIVPSVTPTSASTVQFTITFSGAATGINTSNFTLTTTGVTGAAISSVSGSGTNWTVTVNTGSGNGTIRLDMSNSSGVSPAVTGIPYTSGTLCTIYKTTNNTDYFRSRNTSSVWNTASDWESSFNNSLWVTASAIPTSSASAINIQNGHTMTLPTSFNATVDAPLNLVGVININGNTFTLNNTITGSGTFSGSVTSNLSIGGSSGGSAGTIYFTSGNGILNNLTVNRSGTTASVTLGNSLQVYNTVTLSNGTLNTGGFLTLRSTEASTARVSQLTGTGALSGNITAERYVPSKAIRKYSFIASPVTANIAASWQQQIHITGTGTGGVFCANASPGNQPTQHTNGFDATQTSAASMFYYDQLGTPSRWISISGTSNANLNPGIGYRLNVRGPRSLGCSLLGTSSPAAPAAVTLSATGVMNSGNFPVSISGIPSGSAYTLIGNPYPCEIDFTSFRNDASNSGVISNSFWCHNPQQGLGNNIYSSYNNGVGTNFPVGYSNNNIIASGQAFFVEKTTTGTGIVTFKETHKTTTYQKGMFKTTGAGDIIRICFKQSDTTAIDEAVVRFNSFGSNVSVNPDWDARSLNSGTHIATVKAQDYLAIDTRSDVNYDDTVSLFIEAEMPGSYLLQFTDNNQLNTSVQLLDHFAGQATNISVNTYYQFNVTSDPLTQSNRFALIFGSNNPLQEESIKLSTFRNVDGIKLQWNDNIIETQDYYLQRSADGVQFATIYNTIGSNKDVFQYTDRKPLMSNYYRVKAVDKAGKIRYSKVAQVKWQNNIQPGIIVSPNPVKGNNCSVHLSQLPAGRYHIEIFNVQGSSVSSEYIQYDGLHNMIPFVLPVNISSGSYLIRLTGEGVVLQNNFLIHE